MSHSSPAHQEQRRHRRHICSVLSEAFAVTGDSRRYIGPGVVIDMSESGMAFAMDSPPHTDIPLFIQNPYFEVRAHIRNRTTRGDGTRLGLEFTSVVHWHREPDTLPIHQPPPAAAHASESRLPAAETRKYDPYAVYRRFFDLLAEARRKLPEAIRRAGYLRETGRKTPEPDLRCDLCKKLLPAPTAAPDVAVYIPLSICHSCLIDAAPFGTTNVHRGTTQSLTRT